MTSLHVRTIPYAVTQISPEAQAAAMRVLQSGWVTSGPEVLAFEEEFAAWTGAPHAIAVSSCTEALELSLRAMGLPAGALVYTPTWTFCGAVHAIVRAGLRPVLVDVDQDTLQPTPEIVARAVAQHGPAAALVVMHMAGLPAPVHDLAAAAGVGVDRVVEDAAHGLGGTVGEAPIGTISAATCFSFYATKNLPLGEGGMVTTADPALADAVRQARMHGMSADAWRRYLPGGGWRYDVVAPGQKANLTDLQAAMGRAQLAHLHDWQTRRREVVRRYDLLLSGRDVLDVPPPALHGQHAYHLYVVQLTGRAQAARDDIAVELGRRGIGTSVHFIPVHRLTYFAGLLGQPPDEFPGAEAAFGRVLSLPLHPGLTDGDIDHVAAELLQITTAPALTGALR